MKTRWIVSSILVGVALVATGMVAGSVWTKATVSSTAAAPTPTALVTPHAGNIIDRLGRHIVLPTSEAPTIIMVNDAELLKNAQQFFAQAKNGDVVVVYAKKVILYDPVADKVVEVAYVK